MQTPYYKLLILLDVCTQHYGQSTFQNSEPQNCQLCFEKNDLKKLGTNRKSVGSVLFLIVEYGFLDTA